jgi:predicted GNAT family acetyltransferase
MVDGKECLLEYSLTKTPKAATYNLFHTEVPPELQGRGLAKILVTQALDQIAAEQGQTKIVPSCSYVQKVVKEHQDKYKSLL